MYEIRLTRSFRRSFKKIVRSGREKNIEIEVETILDLISKNKKLHQKYEDHALKGAYIGYRECHIKPNLLLIYKIEHNIVFVINIGSHPELFS